MMDFTPTKKQLEALAKVAGVDYCTDGGDRIWLDKVTKLWQPHEDRNQIAMILEGMSEEETIEYNLALVRVIATKEYSTYHPIIFGQKLPAHISCRIICETLNLEE